MPTAKKTAARKPRQTKAKTAAAPRRKRRITAGADDMTASVGKLFHAGLNALSIPRAESAMAEGISKIADSIGLKKLEDVFDQRVAAALERIGMPSAEELRRLVDAMDKPPQSSAPSRRKPRK